MKTTSLYFNFVLLFAFSLILSSCGNKTKAKQGIFNDIGMQESANKSGSATPVLAKEVNTEKKLVKEGEISLETTSITSLKSKIATYLKLVKGYVSIDRVSGYENYDENYIEVRIPASNFEYFLKLLANSKAKITTQNIRVNDVSAQFSDLATRIKTKKDLEARYILILSKANSVTDLLAIEQELGKLRGDIEVMEGSFNLLDNQIQLSTLQITISTHQHDLTSFGGRILESLSSGWTIFIGLLLILVKLWPMLLIAGVVIYFIRRTKIAKKARVNK
jgi:Domain of unknown function (DUF4349)